MMLCCWSIHLKLNRDWNHYWYIAPPRYFHQSFDHPEMIAKKTHGQPSSNLETRLLPIQSLISLLRGKRNHCFLLKFPVNEFNFLKAQSMRYFHAVITSQIILLLNFPSNSMSWSLTFFKVFIELGNVFQPLNSQARCSICLLPIPSFPVFSWFNLCK